MKQGKQRRPVTGGKNDERRSAKPVIRVTGEFVRETASCSVYFVLHLKSETLI